jgi:hypothetical protein
MDNQTTTSTPFMAPRVIQQSVAAYSINKRLMAFRLFDQLNMKFFGSLNILMLKQKTPAKRPGF